MTKLCKLEALRGFAAIYVVLHHAVPHEFGILGLNLGWLVRFGQEAVILFFLISGFVINFSFVRSSDKRFTVFLTKRVARVYIPLLLVFALQYLLTSVSAGHAVDPKFGVLLLNLLMLQDFGGVKPGVVVEPYLGNTPLWSLSYEWWFYMAYFVLMTQVGTERRRRSLVLLAGVAATALYMVWPHFLLPLPMYLCIWWVGVEASNLYLSGKPLTVGGVRSVAVGLCVISLLLLVNAAFHVGVGHALVLGAYPVLEVRHFLFALAALFAALLWSRVNWFGFDATLGHFALLAPISYALYIVHYNLVNEVGPLRFLLEPPWRWLASIILAIGVSYVIEVVAYPRIRRTVEMWTSGLASVSVKA